MTVTVGADESKASDDEFFHRALHYLGRSSIINLELPLYYNTMRDGSLFADMVKWNPDGSIQQVASPARQAYVEAFNDVHKSTSIEHIGKKFSFPKIRDSVPVFPEMTKLSNPRIPVVVNICSIPERADKLERILRGISRQCDQINIYLDRYDEEPSFLKKLGIPVKVFQSQQLPNLRDNGKFIELERIVNNREDVYYFTIDDDIDYPDDYINTMLKCLNKYADGVAVGVHGVILKDHPRGYFSDRRNVYMFTRQLETDRLVNILGTGTVAFRTKAISSFSLQLVI